MKTKTPPIADNLRKSDGFLAVAISALFCFFGRHKWQRVSTQPNGIGFLDECKHCGRGQYLAWAGHASETGKISAAEMKAWRDEVSQQNASGDQPKV